MYLGRPSGAMYFSYMYHFPENKFLANYIFIREKREKGERDCKKRKKKKTTKKTRGEQKDNLIL